MKLINNVVTRIHIILLKLVISNSSRYVDLHNT